MIIDSNVQQNEERRLEKVMIQIITEIETCRLKIIEQKETLKGINRDMMSEFKFETESMVDLEGAAVLYQYQTMGQNVENAMGHQYQRGKELARLKQSAYFAKIVFKEKGEGEEEIYIGSASLVKEGGFDYLIYDWRAPICSIFYDYEEGEVSYSAPMGVIKGNLLNKRHFKIKNGEIEYMFDSNINIMDDMLKEALAKSVDDKMKTIITTIQKEQNQVIRDEIADVLVVSGSAGSGKTSIALHRIAYLMYKNRAKIIPSDILIFTPNDIFSDYISHVLPELGERNVESITFNDYIKKALGIYMPMTNLMETESRDAQDVKGNQQESDIDDDTLDETEKYSKSENHEQEQQGDPYESKILVGRWTDIESYYEQMEYLLSPVQDEAYLSRVQSMEQKSSVEFFEAYDRYLDAIENRDDLFEDIVFKNHVIISADEIREAYMDCVGIIKCSSRLLQVRNRILTKVKELKKTVAYQYEQQLINSPEYYTKSELKIKTYKYVKRSFKPIHKKIKKMASLDMIDLYNDFLASIQLSPIDNSLYFEDALCLMYMKGRLDSIKDASKVKYLFIDEAQDYALIHYKIIKLVFGHCKYTLLGDPNQAIHPYISSKVTGDIEDFLGDNPKNIRLTKTYRSTKQISDFCNQLLGKSEDASNILRDGNVPQVIAVSDSSMAEGIINKVIDYLSSNMRSIAIIGKTKAHCEALYENLDQYIEGVDPEYNEASIELGLINNEDQFYKTGIIVIPSYLAKGLEFDGVIVVADDTYNYHHERERNLFYTVCTRALHELTVFYENTKPELLMY